MEFLDLLGLAVPLFLLALAWFTGSAVERRHFRSLAIRERETSGMLVSQLKSFPASRAGSPPPCLVVSQVVIATDYLKSFLAGLRKIIGGELRSYRSLVERARREAILRLVEEARGLGYDAVCNIRIESSDVGGSERGKGATMVTLLASGTAYHAARESAA